MCLKLLSGLFNKPAPAPLLQVLPFPEEPADLAKTIYNVNVPAVLNEWLARYGVPLEHQEFWLKSIFISVRDDIAVAACAWAGNGGVRYLEVRPEYLNPGVIAHEQAHCSWELMEDAQRAAFSAAHTRLRETDPLIKLLYSINNYGLTNDNEGHSEVYRYLGTRMPAILKWYYPRLF